MPATDPILAEHLTYPTLGYLTRRQLPGTGTMPGQEELEGAVAG